MEDGIVKSPCIGVCTVDPATLWCVGCFRTIDEIAEWRDATARDQRAMLARIQLRRASIDAVQRDAVPVAED